LRFQRTGSLDYDLLSNKTPEGILTVWRNQLPYLLTMKVKVTADLELADEFSRKFVTIL
jgi:hypothetical protein